MQVDYKKLFTICANRGFTLSYVAEISQIPRQTIANIRTGKNITTVTAGKIAKALGVSVDEILKD